MLKAIRGWMAARKAVQAAREATRTDLEELEVMDRGLRTRADLDAAVAHREMARLQSFMNAHPELWKGKSGSLVDVVIQALRQPSRPVHLTRKEVKEVIAFNNLRLHHYTDEHAASFICRAFCKKNGLPDPGELL